ncbi:hypothetical protein [Brevundimonas sp.]|uniref:hypothetical protein n=1 Tax=Brevundimonas sp. TaxID=1871086 RepID=UPI003D13AA50
MRILDRTLAAVAVLLVCGCGDGQASVDRPPAPAPAQMEATAGQDTAARDEATALAWLREQAQEPGLAERYEQSIKARIERVSVCQTDQCRTAAQADRTAAATFAAGRPARVEGLPFSGGLFARKEPDFSGPVRIVPLDGGSALLVIGLSFKDRPSCDFQGVMTPRDEGGWRVKPLTPELPDMVVTANGPDALSLAYADAGHEPWQTDYCTTGVSIDGDYVRG